MTHEELLRRINTSQHTRVGELVIRTNTLRAVVELHKPYKAVDADEGLCCTSCSDWNGQPLVPYPCVTIQTIQKELS